MVATFLFKIILIWKQLIPVTAIVENLENHWGEFFPVMYSC